MELAGQVATELLVVRTQSYSLRIKLYAAVARLEQHSAADMAGEWGRVDACGAGAFARSSL